MCEGLIWARRGQKLSADTGEVSSGKGWTALVGPSVHILSLHGLELESVRTVTEMPWTLYGLRTITYLPMMLQARKTTPHHPKLCNWSLLGAARLSLPWSWRRLL